MRDLDRRTWIQHAAGLAAAIGAAGPARAADDASRPRPTRIKVGQIGVEHAHAAKLSVYRESSDYEVVGVVEPDDRAWNDAREQPAFRGVPRLTREQLLNVEGLQAVLVETRVRDLLGHARACVDAGKHVHLDKPAGESLDDYRGLLDSAARKNLWVQMGYMYRYNPAILALRESLRRGWLGEPFEVHAVMSKVIPPKDRRALAEYPGGAMFELGCHVIDLVVGVLGAPTKVTPFPRRSGRSDDSLRDNMLAVFEYPRATATVRSSGLEVDGFDRRHLVVCGTEGTFHIQPLDRPSARVTFAQPRGPYRRGYQDLSFPKFTRYVADAADMARVIRGEKSNDFPASHDLAVQSSVLLASGLGAG